MLCEHTGITVPLDRDMALQLERLLQEAAQRGFGQVQIIINTRGVKLIDQSEYRFKWNDHNP